MESVIEEKIIKELQYGRGSILSEKPAANKELQSRF